MFTSCLQHPLHLVSTVPIQHPTISYYIWHIKSSMGRAGLDHILIAQEHINSASTSGIDHDISSNLVKFDYCLIYSSFPLYYPHTSPIPQKIYNFSIAEWRKYCSRSHVRKTFTIRLHNGLCLKRLTPSLLRFLCIPSCMRR